MVRRFLFRALAAGLLFLVPPPQDAGALSLSQVRSQVRLLLRDQSSDAAYQRFSDATLNSL